jgi:long-subunit acyl-CoA synthetase (AMP-forming)
MKKGATGMDQNRLYPWSALRSEIPSPAAAKDILEAAETMISSGRGVKPSAARQYLDLTSVRPFLQALGDPELLERWAETAFGMIRLADYTLLDMFESRVREHPRKILFQDMSAAAPIQWTYEQVERRLREIAGSFYAMGEEDGAPPRVAIYAENSVGSACADLACLIYDILDTPINSHFNADNLVEIFDALGITIAVTDREDRHKILAEVRRRTARPFRILTVAPGPKPEEAKDGGLIEYAKRHPVRRLEALLSARRRRPINEVATVMFTSGSTGRPKGVSFSSYNLTAKRFARAAALPDVGDSEVFLSFLPLFHTFGRYFEMLGSIFWRGTYVFAGNPSADTLFTLFPKVNPTGFISVPVRWTQLYERCLEKLDETSIGDRSAVIRSIVGLRLRWGLSAAGYLDPRVFRFFEQAGINVSSGFGMTEGTGGITMTPPGRYIDNTHGLPLPGVRLRLGANDELEASGHYIAPYLEDKKPGDIVPFPENPETDYWLHTGDIFRRLSNGYYQIVDRIKDIYKNNRGQTIAPRKVEDKFIGVPGIKRTFLVGDGRPTNALFIVPDRGDAVLAGALAEDNGREYYRQIVSAANADLAPYERVVNFAVLDRDFDGARGEVTPKGSFNRKRIEENFSGRIEELYRKPYLDLPGPGGIVRIPLWFFRDLGILEDEIGRNSQGLFDRNRKLRLPLRATARPRIWRVGDLEYEIQGTLVDLGLFARQPILWAGNPALIRFSPCKEGWDLPLDPVTDRVFLPSRRARLPQTGDAAQPKNIRDPHLLQLNENLVRVLFSGRQPLGKYLDELEKNFQEPDLRTTSLIRSRLRALSGHPNENVRCWAYRLLLLDNPSVDYSRLLPTFVQSGKPFLNARSIEEIVSARLGKNRLNSLRRRMIAYRETLAWPAGPVTRLQFERILCLFADLARVHPEFFGPVRAELAAWALHTADSRLAATAESLLARLAREIESNGGRASSHVLKNEDRLVFEEGLEPGEIRRLKKILVGTTFLHESVRFAFSQDDFNPKDIPPGGVWISRAHLVSPCSNYRISLNTASGRHYDLKLFLKGRSWTTGEWRTILWSTILADHPEETGVIAPLGAIRLREGAVSRRYIGDLTLWEKIREFAGRRGAGAPPPETAVWRKLYIEGISVFFRAWKMSGRRVVPGPISPVNVIVPEIEFRDETVIASLDRRDPYRNTLSLVRPIVDHFYRRAAADYPWIREQVDLEWIFDACYNALGREEAAAFFARLQDDARTDSPRSPEGGELLRLLSEYRVRFEKNYQIPLPGLNAVRTYQEWEATNPTADSRDRERKVLDLLRKYDLGRYPEIVRYYLYRNTYFAGRSEKKDALFDRLLGLMSENPEAPAVRHVEISDLQAALRDERDRAVFSRMIFPYLEPDHRLDVVVEGGEGAERVVVRSFLTDRRGETYTFNETTDPADIGRLYRLFYKENFPKVISQQDRHFILQDRQDRVVGGLCYRIMSRFVVFIDAVAVTSRLKASGLGGAVVDDFCGRMSGQGYTTVLTHFYLPGFFLRRGFRLDKKWGALAKSIGS